MSVTYQRDIGSGGRPESNADNAFDSALQLAELVDVLCPELVRVVDGPCARMVGELTIVGADTTTAKTDALLLGIGLSDSDAAVAFLERVAGYGPAALLMKAPLPSQAPVRASAARAGITLIEVHADVAWEQLFVMLRRLLDLMEPSARWHCESGGDLFQLANEIQALIDAPITIVDAASRVLAYSSGQDEVDDARVQTVLCRQVPDDYQRELVNDGVFRQLADGADPIYVPTVSPGSLPREIAAVRIGGKLLGSIWAVVSGPMSEQRRRVFKDAADMVAIQLLHERSSTTDRSRQRTENFVALIEQAKEPAEVLRSLGVLGQSLSVVAVELDGSDSAYLARASELQRVCDALGIQLRMLHRLSVTAIVGDVIYGLTSAPDEACVLRVVAELVRGTGSRHPLRAGVGRMVSKPAEIAHSVKDADDILRVLRHGGGVVASASTARAELMVLRLAESSDVHELPLDSPVSRLLDYDLEYGSSLTESLVAYLDMFGDVRRASEYMHVHPNTFRYRLGRMSAVAGLDLDDPDVRFAAMIDLRLSRYVDSNRPMPGQAGRAKRPAPAYPH
ncbi:PucR family transcriptional regulator [Mycolicibacterium sp.]|uniref:PucR family transcriptional regulator n=1 Tax=Mycolicibacterium sp. TaxID=2320850 RepID=UPI003D10E8F1